MQKNLKRRLPNFLFLGLVWVEFIRVFFGEWSYNEQYSYGFFVPLLSLYLVYLRIESTPPRGRGEGNTSWIILMGACLLLLIPIRLVLGANPEWRLALWLYGIISVVITVGQLAYWGGWPWIRHYLSPLLLILFAIPWPSGFEQSLVQGMMRAVATIVVEFLNIFGIYAEQHGNLIRLSSGLIGVEEACSGVRSFQSTIMAAFFFGALFHWNIPARLLLIITGSAVSILLNIVRTLILTWVTIARGQDAMEVLHDPVGHMVSLGAFFVLFLLTWIINRFLVGHVTRKVPGNLRLPQPQILKTGWTVLLTALLVSAPLLSYAWYRNPPDLLDQQISSSINWESIDDVSFEEIPTQARAMLRYSDGKHAKWKDPSGTRWSAFFFQWKGGTVSSHVSVHTPEVCLPSAGFDLIGRGQPVTYTEEDTQLIFENYQFSVPGQTLHVYFSVWNQNPGKELSLGADWQSRIQAAWNGERIQGRYSLQLVLYNVPNESIARSKVSRFLDKAFDIEPIFND